MDQWIKLTDTKKIKAAALALYIFVEIRIISGLCKLLGHVCFCTDLHPDNLFTTVDKRIAFINCGMMDQLEEETKETITNYVVQLIHRDYNA
jgi:predicted unusual protein kinase regulating ubiquinone biosynthesis (AarF/ABC1/UbiB family)